MAFKKFYKTSGNTDFGITERTSVSKTIIKKFFHRPPRPNSRVNKILPKKNACTAVAFYKISKKFIYTSSRPMIFNRKIGFRLLSSKKKINYKKIYWPSIKKHFYICFQDLKN